MAKKIQGTSTVVRIISSKGSSALVEYEDVDGVLQRKFVPTAKVMHFMVADDVLASGIPYGLPWDEIVMEFDPKQLLIEMHNADLWTAEDVLRSPKKVSGVLRKVLEGNLKALLETALQESKRS